MSLTRTVARSLLRILLGVLLASLCQILSVRPAWAFFYGWCAGSIIYDWILPITERK